MALFYKPYKFLSNETKKHNLDFVDAQYHDIILKAHLHYPNVPTKMITALISMESSGNRLATSNRGAQGLMQLMPGTAQELGVMDPYNSTENINAGTHYMSRMLKKYAGDVDMSLAAYNEGTGNLDRKGIDDLPDETSNYINKYHRILGE